VSVPLVWKVLPKETRNGNSTSSHRRALVEKLLEILPAKEIRVLLMDREFLGSGWLEWLDRKGIGYVLRIKSNTLVGDKHAHEYRGSKGKKTTIRHQIWGQSLFFGSKKIKSSGADCYLYVASNRFIPKEALVLYRKRWAIEQLFSHLKKRGFNLED